MISRIVAQVAALAALLLSQQVAAGAGPGLRAGYARVEITPHGPVTMGGYDLRKSPSDGIYEGDKLYVRALVFDDGASRVAFVEGDIIGADYFERLQAAISRATGIPAGNILLGDVHNHAAPSPDETRNGEWTRQFESSIVSVVEQAVAGLRPVKIAAGQGRSHINVNRRAVRLADADSTWTFDENARSQSFGEFATDKPKLIHEFEGEMRLGANPTRAVDDAVQLVRIDADDKPMAVMIHYPCHGTSLGGRNSKISAEWMGRMEKYVESQIPGVGAFYVQGAAGDVNPRIVGGLDGQRDDIRQTWALGEEIGREVVRVYRGLSPATPAADRIRIVQKDILLPRAYRELYTHFLDPAVHVPTTAVRIGDLMWVTFPGELFNAIGKHVKDSCPTPYCHLMGYTNGYVGYFPEQQSYAEGGYEPAMSHLAPTAERIYMREIAELMKQVGSGF